MDERKPGSAFKIFDATDGRTEYYERGLDDLRVAGKTWVSKKIGTIFLIYFNSKHTNTRY